MSEATETAWPLDQRTIGALARSSGALLIINAPEHAATALRIARTIHLNGPRRMRPFYHLSCAGLPPDLLASELFGHRADLASGRFRDKPGLIELADGGTLCLVGIDSVPPGLQTALCRLIDSKLLISPVRPALQSVDVRVIATMTASTDRTGSLMDRISRDLQDRLTLVPLGVA